MHGGMRFSASELQAVVGDMTQALLDQGLGAGEVAEIVSLLYGTQTALAARHTPAHPEAVRPR